jgi:hypothetical protein
MESSFFCIAAMSTEDDVDASLDEDDDDDVVDELLEDDVDGVRTLLLLCLGFLAFLLLSLACLCLL